MQAVGRSAFVLAMAFTVAAMSAGCSASDAEAEGSSLARLSGDGSFTAPVSGTGTDGLRIRAEPNTASAVLGLLEEGTRITIGCQTTGVSVNGTEIWDYLPQRGGYVSDAFVLTGYDGFVPGVKRCTGKEASGAASKPPASGGGGAPSSMAANAIAKARGHIGYVEQAGDCNIFSSYWGRPCQAWCADFVEYAWNEAGYSVDRLTGYSGTIYDYGNRYGTTKSPSSANVKPGDAVLWGAVGGYSAHVGMVTAVNGDSISVIHGNFGVGPGGAGAVYESTISRSDTVGTGYSIYAFVSPVAK